MPELRRQLGCPPDPAAFRTTPTSGIDAPNLQSGWLREPLAEGSKETGR